MMKHDKGLLGHPVVLYKRPSSPWCLPKPEEKSPPALCLDRVSGGQALLMTPVPRIKLVKRRSTRKFEARGDRVGPSHQP